MTGAAKAAWIVACTESKGNNSKVIGATKGGQAPAQKVMEATTGGEVPARILPGIASQKNIK